jgi:hypothetical protein
MEPDRGGPSKLSAQAGGCPAGGPKRRPARMYVGAFSFRDLLRPPANNSVNCRQPLKKPVLFVSIRITIYSSVVRFLRGSFGCELMRRCARSGCRVQARLGGRPRPDRLPGRHGRMGSNSESVGPARIRLSAVITPLETSRSVRRLADRRGLYRQRFSKIASAPYPRSLGPAPAGRVEGEFVGGKVSEITF